MNHFYEAHRGAVYRLQFWVENWGQASILDRGSHFRRKIGSYQHPGVNAPVRHITRLTQRLEEQLSVVIAAEDLLPAIPTRHDVVKATGILNANTTRYAAQSALTIRSVSLSRIDA